MLSMQHAIPDSLDPINIYFPEMASKIKLDKFKKYCFMQKLKQHVKIFSKQKTHAMQKPIEDCMWLKW